MCVLNKKSCMLHSLNKKSAQRPLNELQVFKQNKNGRFWTPESPRNLKLTSEKDLEVEYFHCGYVVSVCCLWCCKPANKYFRETLSEFL